jgi:hemerythrin
MGKIVWDSSFSVNVPEIDEQHRKWIGMINELHNTMMEGNVRKVTEISTKIIADVRDYTRYHFSTEEKFMQKIDYPGLPAHKKIHDDFYVRVKQLYNDIAEGKTVLDTEIMKTLSNWLRDHILNEDKKFVEYI